jgi:hypothetical protein
MKLESLPNEIFLDLFEYFYGVELLNAFYGLNSRFNFILYKHFRFYCLDFQSLSKRNFDVICQQHLPFIADRVIQLQLYGYDDMSQQINLFLSYIPSFGQFTHLRSLMLSNLHSYETLLKLLDKCQYLDSLTHLTFSSCSCSNGDANFQLIVDKIWSLTKLTKCSFGIDIGQTTFCLPTITSFTLKYLTVSGSKLELNQLNQLFDYTPRLLSMMII